MTKAALLENYVKLLLETMYEHPQAPFKLTDDTPEKCTNEGDFTLNREFPLVMTDTMMQFMGVDQSELEGNMLMGPHEIQIDVESRYSVGKFKGSLEEPPDDDEFELENWDPLSLNGMWLTDVDAKSLKVYLGNLTDEEEEALMDLARDAGPPGPDYYYDD